MIALQKDANLICCGIRKHDQLLMISVSFEGQKDRSCYRPDEPEELLFALRGELWSGEPLVDDYVHTRRISAVIVQIASYLLEKPGLL